MGIIIIIVVVVFSSRILSNLQDRSGGIFLYKELYNRYREYELFEQGTPVDSATFVATSLHIFDIRKLHRRQGQQRLLFYSGLAFYTPTDFTIN